MGINEELWDFPCDYTLKVMGAAHHPMLEIVCEIIERHITDWDRSQTSLKNSRTGKYISVTAFIRLEHKAQVEAIYSELDAREEVAWKL